MKKITYSLIILVGIGLFSCTKDWDKLNKNPNQLEKPSPEQIMNFVFKSTIDQMAQNNMSFFWAYAHHLTVTASRYNTQSEQNWRNMYINVLGNLNQMQILYAKDPNYNNRVQIAKIWECYVYAYLVGLYGPIPLSEAMSTSQSIKYDSENEVYRELLIRLKAAGEAITPNGDKLTQDVVLNGNNARWKKFANSLRLRIALRCIRNQPDEAITAIQELMGNETELLTSNSDNVKMSYGAGDVNESPYYTRLVRNPVVDGLKPKLSNYLFTYFRSFEDPRLNAYFESPAYEFRPNVIDTLSSTQDDTLRVVSYRIPHLGQNKTTAPLPAWGITGSNPLSGVLVTGYSDPKPFILADNYAFKIMDYAEICFLKAEASELGYIGNRSSEQYYYEGIEANMNAWSIYDTQAVSSYKSRNGVKWGTSNAGMFDVFGVVRTGMPAEDITKARIQQWINYYPDGAFDAWCLQRATQSLNLPPLTNSGNQFLSSDVTDIPDRWEYPLSAKSYNPLGYTNAVASIGGIDYPNVILNFAVPPQRINWKNISGFYNPSASLKQYGTTIQGLIAAGIPYTVQSKFKR